MEKVWVAGQALPGGGCSQNLLYLYISLLFFGFFGMYSKIFVLVKPLLNQAFLFIFFAVLCHKLWCKLVFQNTLVIFRQVGGSWDSKLLGCDTKWLRWQLFGLLDPLEWHILPTGHTLHIICILSKIYIPYSDCLLVWRSLGNLGAKMLPARCSVEAFKESSSAGQKWPIAHWLKKA